VAMETTTQDIIQETIEEINKTADAYPGAVVIHNLQDLKILYMSARAIEGLQIPWEEIQNISFEDYHKTYFNPEDAAEYFPKIQEMLKKNSPHEMVSFFQQVRTSKAGEWEWYLTSMKVLLNDEDGMPLLTISFAIPIDPKDHVTNKVNRLLEENNFLRSHLSKFSSLGKREKEILKLVANGRSNFEISEELFISERTVETHRKNIKRKLKIKTVYDLQQYARAFDLI
jgi:DNA-binding CsgD family transcriptional regulator